MQIQTTQNQIQKLINSQSNLLQIHNEFISPHDEQQTYNITNSDKHLHPQPKKQHKNNKINRSIKQSVKQRSETSKDVEQSPEYYRINNEICNKLYEVYKKMKINLSNQTHIYSFQEKQHSNNTLNYHKIMQMFKDLEHKLEINQKLQILRSIKKFCFNQNFISQQEFIKIYKVIVHAIGVKEIAFKALVQTKIAEMPKKDQILQKKNLSIKINKNFKRKMKTQMPLISEQQYKAKDRQSLIHEHRTLDHIPNNQSKKFETSPIQKIEESKNRGNETVRRGQNRKRMVTQIKRNEIGINRGYLQRAIQRNKLGKLTWQNLFKMSENNLHNNIIIPDFVHQGMNQFDLDI